VGAEADAIRNDNPAGASQGTNGEDCFKVLRTSKRVEIPCTRNEYRRYKVSVPKTIHSRVPRRVQYTDFEIREREEPYTVKRCETAYRDEEQPYTVQIPKKVTKMVKVTKKVPKTVYVDVVTEEPLESTIMVPETRTRVVKVPYQKQFVDQKYRKVKENVPVTKYRTEYDTVSKTIYEDAWRTKVVPVTKIVRKEIPVFNVVLNEDCGNCDQVDQVYAGTAGNVITGNPDRTEQETYQNEVDANAEAPAQPTPAQNNSTHTETGQTFQAAQQYEQPPAPDSGVMHQPDVQAATSGAAHQIVARPSSQRQGVDATHPSGERPASLRQPVGAVHQTSARPASLRQTTNNQMVNQAPAAPIRAPVQAINYHDGAQWTNQMESAPVTNEIPPQYDPPVQQVYPVPQQYTPRMVR